MGRDAHEFIPYTDTQMFQTQICSEEKLFQFYLLQIIEKKTTTAQQETNQPKNNNKTTKLTGYPGKWWKPHPWR